MPLTLATYNIHRCIGRDGKLRPERIAEVLKELRADVVALQEVESRDHGGLDLLAHFTAHTGLAAIAGHNIYRHGTRYGNALLTRLPVVAMTRLDLSFGKREPRGAIDVQLAWGMPALWRARPRTICRSPPDCISTERPSPRHNSCKAFCDHTSQSAANEGGDIEHKHRGISQR